ncbi:MAG TPA: pyridoxamine 5'-phosphate oxidase family protein [Anaerolineales bacterium]|nr:pyridoxamine 5'-phosphate oxidase family protein [Anaerolineales bacterium]
MRAADSVAPLADLLAILDETIILTLASLDADGSPRATPLYFALQTASDPAVTDAGASLNSDVEAPFAFLFLSDPDSVHIRNVEREPHCSVAAYPAESDWRRLRGVQAKGVVGAVAEADRQDAMAVYRRRVTAVDDVPAAVARSRLYRIRPTWIRCIDNRLGFGHRQEWTWR